MSQAMDAGYKSAAVGRLAEWVIRLEDEAIGTPAMEAAKLLLLDTIGCAIGGWHEQVARGVCATVIDAGGSGQVQIIGSTHRTNGANAVLANGVLARVLDLNDYVANSPAEGGELGGHPSDNIPVALAAAEAGGRNGKDLLAAIVIGYEVFARGVALMQKRSTWDRSSVSGLVAPAIAGRLLGLDVGKLSHALALSTVRCATSAMVRSGDISAAKSIANALVAQSGYQSVLLAAEGITGPLQILEHETGMRTVFTGIESSLDALSNLSQPLPSVPYVMRARIKAYPCVATSQSLAKAAVALHEVLKGRQRMIERIHVSMADYQVVRRHQSERVRLVPSSREAADHSFPFIAVVGIMDGDVGHSQFEGERWTDPRTLELISKVVMTTDDTLNARSSAGYPARIEVECSDGTRHVHEVLEPPGGGAAGIDAGEVVAKFRRVSDGLIPAAAASRIVDCVMSLDERTSCSALPAALAVNVQA